MTHIYTCQTCGRGHRSGTWCSAHLLRIGHPLSIDPKEAMKKRLKDKKRKPFYQQQRGSESDNGDQEWHQNSQSRQAADKVPSRHWLAGARSIGVWRLETRIGNIVLSQQKQISSKGEMMKAGKFTDSWRGNGWHISSYNWTVAFRWRWHFYFVKLPNRQNVRRVYLGPFEIEYRGNNQ